MVDITFVILHYLASDLTMQSVSYIQKNIDTDNYHIVIVDNASPNDSFSELQKEYSDAEKITLIHNDKNLGFAKGNNVGFRYARDKVDSKYIVLMNNDVNLTDTALFSKLESEYKESSFYVAGPGIYYDGVKSEGDNPFVTYFPTIEFIRFMIKRKKTDVFFTKLNLYEFLRFIRRVLSKLKISKFPECPPLPAFKNGKPGPDEKLYNVGLFGCFFVFSPNYIKEYDGLDERTFMYCEELILMLHLLAKNQTSVYLPDISVEHIGKGSTKRAMKDKKRKLFDFENSITGFNVCLDILEKFKAENGCELHEKYK